MEYLKLNSVKRILKWVKTNNGSFGWYGIVTYVDKLPNAVLDPPSFYVLQWLVRDGFLREEASEKSNSPKYWLTEKGQNFLNEND